MTMYSYINVGCSSEWNIPELWVKYLAHFDAWHCDCMIQNSGDKFPCYDWLGMNNLFGSSNKQHYKVPTEKEFSRHDAIC